ncbi:peptide ABC transporter substrate-binding protein [Sulfurifustis variabilis]|uniref:Peptide ABC transporter substrate-binding protein n=1 Tax=Sulfurifustis variabilis TaxID=1675686 RepID=A0A1B4VBE4_9GAMM|nr:ABC transporter substrate-binding protein [Sulfurifustis variabilis]BAU47881.1 peptide ABC transporter substrate-binding protein [Sulfurifustis variabilis]
MLGLLVLIGLAPPVSGAWNNPYPEADRTANTLYAAFRERPKHLDPARSYNANEYLFIAQIYEPPFQYHYLRRPYELVPLAAAEVPIPIYLDARGRRLPDDAPADAISQSVYEIRVRPGIYFQPHPAFARDAQGRLLYHDLSHAELARIRTVADFEKAGTRELTAADYVYQIKRLAHPRLHSPILSVMADYIVGMREYATTLGAAQRELSAGGKGGAYIDLTKYALPGAEEVDRYTYRVRVHGKYPQFLYWMAMPFFAPMAPEADRFFAQAGMAERNLTLDWYPVGTGAYMLTVNDPNRQMMLERNPNYREERYPSDGEPADDAAGLLADAGRPLPFIDKVVFSLEKESIPYWTKFLQGYYDRSGVLREAFDQAIRFTGSGEAALSESMEERGVRLVTSIDTSTFYLGFNMLDSVVGGYTERARKLRQAISIAVDYEEYISIFRNGLGIAAQGPLPPGIFGYREGPQGVNPFVYDWVDGQPKRKSIDAARRLLAEAGYPNGQDDKSGGPLVLYYDTAATGPEDKAQLDWMRKQLGELNIQLVVRATDYNRFQEKMRKGDAQLYVWGWNADYPDPENFFFLLYGPNKKVGHDGENASNYDNPEFNRLFERMKNMENGPARQAIIDRMLEVVREDAPWAWGLHPKTFTLQHAWVHNAKPNQMANNTLKYLRIEPEKRAGLREAWNRPVVWPVAALLAVVVASGVPAVVSYRRREARSQRAGGSA